VDPEEYRIGEVHYLAFAQLSAAQGFRIAFALFGGYLLFVLAVIALVGGDTLLWSFAGFAAFLLALVCNNRFRALPRLTKAAYREDVQIKETRTLIYDAEGYAATFASGLVRQKWANLVKWDEDDHIFVVYSNRQMGHIFPKDQVQSHVIDDIRQHLVASGLPQRGKLRK
jgi:YcxB-like protein